MPNAASSKRTSLSIQIRIGPSTLTTHWIGRATSKRDAFRRIDGDGLRQHLGEDHDDRRHHEGRIDHADIAEPRQHQAGRKRGRRDIDRIVAEQDPADQPLARFESAG